MYFDFWTLHVKACVLAVQYVPGFKFWRGALDSFLCSVDLSCTCAICYSSAASLTPLLWLTLRDTYHCSSHLLDLSTWGFSKHPPMGAGLLFSSSCVRDAFHSTAQTLSYSYWFWPGPMSLFVLLLKLQSVRISLSRFCRGYLPCTNLLLLIRPLNGPLLAAIDQSIVLVINTPTASVFFRGFATVPCLTTNETDLQRRACF